MNRRSLGRGRGSRNIPSAEAAGARKRTQEAHSRGGSFRYRQPRALCNRRLQLPAGTDWRSRTEDHRRRAHRRSNSARRFGAPLLARGGGTSLAGQCCNVAVVLDFTKYLNKLIDLDPQAKTARVQPGIVLDWLRNEAERHHLTFGPDPSTHNHNTLGGMIGNNSCGTHSVMAGKTEENVIELDILTYDGLRMRVGATADEEYRRIIDAGGRRGEIYTGLKQIAVRYGERDPPPVSEHSAPRVRLQPAGPAARKRIQRGALAGRY